MSTEMISDWAEAPDFKLKDLDNKQWMLKDYAGKWTVIDFWGTWCGPCVAEMPEIEAFNKEILAGKHPDAAFLSIACKDYLESVKPYVEKNQLTIPVLMSDNKIQFKYKLDGYPYKVMISPNGRMIALDRSKDWRKVLKLFSSTLGKLE
jgi:thiol-disulfide isomerase/thioredoxin